MYLRSTSQHNANSAGSGFILDDVKISDGERKPGANGAQCTRPKKQPRATNGGGRGAEVGH